MFKLFKKKVEEKQTGKYPAIVEEIHYSFNVASDKLLEDAYKVLEEKNLSDVKKGLRLKEIGFKQALQVKEAEKTLEERNKAEKLAKLIMYYKEKYPLNKFITEESVNTICQKYGLVQGGIDLYKGFVPSDKIDQISNFSLKDEDKREGVLIKVKKIELYDTEKTENKEKRNMLLSHLKEKNNLINVKSSRYSSYTSEKIEDYIKENFNITCRSASGEELNLNELSICAPIKDMYMTGKTIVGNKIMSNSKLKVTYVDKDPVVLQPVKEGFLIVCAWGDEASDPLVVNEIMN